MGIVGSAGREEGLAGGGGGELVVWGWVWNGHIV